MALKKVKGNFERMFDKNLTDLVRGIRNNKDNEVNTAFQLIAIDMKKKKFNKTIAMDVSE